MSATMTLWLSSVPSTAYKLQGRTRADCEMPGSVVLLVACSANSHAPIMVCWRGRLAGALRAVPLKCTSCQAMPCSPRATNNVALSPTADCDRGSIGVPRSANHGMNEFENTTYKKVIYKLKLLCRDCEAEKMNDCRVRIEW